MKHINESIIGRRNAGTQTISDMGLRQGDLLYLKYMNSHPYMVIFDKDLYESVMYPESLKLYDFSKGVLVCLNGNNLSFITIDKYNKKLQCIPNSDCDIIEVYRGPIKPITPNNIRKFISENNLNQMVGNFRLIFKNGKWL